MIVQSLFGGWFGLHYFSLGKIWRGLFQVLGLICALVYTFFATTQNIRSGYAGFFVLICGFVWVASFIIWLEDIIGIIFNQFKYPVSLPYAESVSTFEADQIQTKNLND